MEKVLLQEINRSLELMGLNHKLIHLNNEKNTISESSILKGLLRNVGDFVKPQIRKLSSGAKEYFLAGEAVSKTFYDAFNKIIKDFDTNWPAFISRPDNLKQLATILRKSPDITKEFYNDLMTDLILKTTTVKSEMNFYRTLFNREKMLGDQFDLDSELDFIIPNEFEKELLFPTIRKNYQDLKNNSFKPTVFPKDVNVLAEKLTKRQIQNFNKVITTSTRYWNNFYQAFNRNVVDLRKEIEALSYGFLEQLPKAADVEEAKALANAYAVQISNKLSLIEMKMKGQAIDIMEEEGLPQDILDILKKDQNQFFRLFRDGIKVAEQQGFDVSKFTDFMAESLKNNMLELGTFFKELFSKKFISAIKHLFNPKTDLGIWYYTNQWAGLNKLFHLAVKTGALQNKKQSLEWLWKALIATNVGYLVGWATKAGIMSVWELIAKPLYNKSIGNFLNFGCGLINQIKPLFDCNELYLEQKNFGDGVGNTVEGALIQEVIGESVDVMTKKYSEDPVFSGMMRLLPVINYIETWRHSMFAKSIEGITERQLFQNYVGGDADKTQKEIINDVRDSIPSTDTASLRELQQVQDTLMLPPDITRTTSATTDTTTVKDILFNHLKTIPELNPGGSKGRIGEPDKGYIYDRGNNIWEFEKSDKKMLKFQYNPDNKTFTQIN